MYSNRNNNSYSRTDGLTRHPLSVHEKNKNAMASSQNKFAVLSQETDRSKMTKGKIKANSNGMALKIKQQETDRDTWLKNHRPVKDQYSYPLVQLTAWGSPKRTPTPIFDDEEDEQQIGPEMRKIYGYLEQVYQDNQHRAIYEEDDDVGDYLSDDSDFDN